MDSAHYDFKNSIVFFRNAWPYLSDSQTKKLLENLSTNFDKNSSLVVGDYDKGKMALDFDNIDAFNYMLYDSGLCEIKPNIYKSYKARKDMLSPIDVINYFTCALKNNLYGGLYYIKSIFENN